MIASGNPAAMEKVKVDTEVRKLDQLRSVHLNQQHSIRVQVHGLPAEIREMQERITRLYAVASRGRTADDGLKCGVYGDGARL